MIMLVPIDTHVLEIFHPIKEVKFGHAAFIPAVFHFPIVTNAQRFANKQLRTTPNLLVINIHAQPSAKPIAAMTHSVKSPIRDGRHRKQ